MTKLNHNRPALRLLDNYRRELRKQSIRVGDSFVVAQNSVENPMPPVSKSARELIFLMFDAANSYFDHFSAWIEALSPDSGKTLRCKEPERKTEFNRAKERLTEACIALVFEAVREASREETGVISWLDWLQKEAQRTKSSGLYDILEIGVKPAFERINAEIDTF